MTELFYFILFLVAFLYASVGHGGASGYLALMALYGFAPEEMKPTALMLNLFVSLTSFIQYYRRHYFVPKLFIAVSIASVPLAFLGGTILLDASLYKKMLGVLLLFPVWRFFFSKSVGEEALKPFNPPLAVAVGGLLGFLSGMIGIGGGILLSPVLVLLKWTDQKQTAAISALFIFVNSLAGLLGQLTRQVSFSSDMLLYVAVAFTGGLLGAYFGASGFSQRILKYLLAVVLLLASCKLLFTTA